MAGPVLKINASTVYFGPQSIVSVSSAAVYAGTGTGTYYEDTGSGYCYVGGGGHGGTGKLIVLMKQS